VHAPTHLVSQVSVSMKKSVFSFAIFSRTMRLFGFRVFINVNLREGVTFTCAAKRSLDMRTLIGRRFVELHEICLLGMGVGSEMFVDVAETTIFPGGTQRVTASAMGFLRGD